MKQNIFWPDGPYTPRSIIGGDGGVTFYCIPPYYSLSGRHNGLIVQRVDVWRNGGAIQGIQFGYANGSRSPVYGTTDGSEGHHSIALELGERIQEAAIYEIKETDGNPRVGGIRITTNKNQKLEVLDTKPKTANYFDVGSGLLIGAVGASGSELDCLGLIFLKDVKKLTVSNVKYEKDPSGTAQGIKPVILSQILLANKSGSEEINYNFTNTVMKTNSTTFTQSSVVTYGVDVTVDASLFDVVKASTEFSWSLQKSSTYSRQTSTEVGLSWSLQGPLKPHTEVIGTAVCQMGELDIPYTAEVTLMMQDGQTFKFDESGTLKHVLYVSAEASVSAPKDTAAS